MPYGNADDANRSEFVLLIGTVMPDPVKGVGTNGERKKAGMYVGRTV